MIKKDRYQRQSILPEIGPAGQAALSRASVLCVGAGGLGSPALFYLAAAGVGHIGIADFDRVEETNLQRQILFTMDQIGRNKAEAARERLRSLNPDIVLETYSERLEAANAQTLFEPYDLIIDGTDNFAAKFLINDAAVRSGKIVIYGAVLGFEGQISVFGAPGGPCYRCLFPDAPAGHVPNCADAGVIGAVAGLIGTMQAMEAIKIIVGHESFQPLIGRLWTVDLRTMENRLLSLPKNPACPACSKNAKNSPLRSPPAPMACGPVPELTPAQVRTQTNALLIDVREQEEWDAGHIEQARLFPLSLMAAGAALDLPKDREIILHCQKGYRSLQAGLILKARGYTNISHMAGGYDAWLRQR
ncbi:MAG: HesA/MoeB/ThiF family protein [Alphaproteobacteria bacterium]|nr:HesA/MoeB/ThiF family protein [Alphaproteobacteria bacterium]